MQQIYFNYTHSYFLLLFFYFNFISSLNLPCKIGVYVVKKADASIGIGFPQLAPTSLD